MLKISLKCGIVTITIPENLSLEEKGKQNSKDKPPRLPSPSIQSSPKLGTTLKGFCWVIKVTHHLTLSRWAQWNCMRREQIVR